MGCGNWTTSSYRSYASSVGRDVTEDGILKGAYSAQQMFRQRGCADELNPKDVLRECCDSSEHPNTLPVILALDVTGSMGSTAVEVAKKLNVIMTKLYDSCKDVEFMIMGIGDLVYDRAPIQISQFESDVRIAEQLDKIWFEGGGGGNNCESYSAAWYMGARHTKLDCTKRGKKAIIITIGDELLNPYLPKEKLHKVTGDNIQGDIKTKDIYEEASENFDIYHLVVSHNRWNEDEDENNRRSFAKVIGEQNVKVVTLDSISESVVSIVESKYNEAGYVDTGATIEPANAVGGAGEDVVKMWGSFGW